MVYMSSAMFSSQLGQLSATNYGLFAPVLELMNSNGRAMALLARAELSDYLIGGDEESHGADREPPDTSWWRVAGSSERQGARHSGASQPSMT